MRNHAANHHRDSHDSHERWEWIRMNADASRRSVVWVGVAVLLVAAMSCGSSEPDRASDSMPREGVPTSEPSVADQLRMETTPFSLLPDEPSASDVLEAVRAHSDCDRVVESVPVNEFLQQSTSWTYFTGFLDGGALPADEMGRASRVELVVVGRLADASEVVAPTQVHLQHVPALLATIGNDGLEVVLDLKPDSVDVDAPLRTHVVAVIGDGDVEFAGSCTTNTSAEPSRAQCGDDVPALVRGLEHAAPRRVERPMEVESIPRKAPASEAGGRASQRRAMSPTQAPGMSAESCSPRFRDSRTATVPRTTPWPNSRASAPLRHAAR